MDFGRVSVGRESRGSTGRRGGVCRAAALPLLPLMAYHISREGKWLTGRVVTCAARTLNVSWVYKVFWFGLVIESFPAISSGLVRQRGARVNARWGEPDVTRADSELKKT